MKQNYKPKGLPGLLADDPSLLEEKTYQQLNGNIPCETDYSLEDAYRAYCEYINR